MLRRIIKLRVVRSALQCNNTNNSHRAVSIVASHQGILLAESTGQTWNVNGNNYKNQTI